LFSIVGTQIYIHQGDECAFKIVHRDEEGNILNFAASDIITLYIRDMNTDKVLLKKISESIIVDSEEVSIFSFQMEDYRVLVPGNYVYDVVIEVNTGTHYTLVDRAYLSVIKSAYAIPEFETGRLTPMSSRSFYLSNTALICKFNHRKIQRKDADGTLILFNRVSPPSVSEDDADDSLILFSNADDDNEESTLIIF